MRVLAWGLIFLSILLLVQRHNGSRFETFQESSVAIESLEYAKYRTRVISYYYQNYPTAPITAQELGYPTSWKNTLKLQNKVAGDILYIWCEDITKEHHVKVAKILKGSCAIGIAKGGIIQSIDAKNYPAPDFIPDNSLVTYLKG